MKPHLYQLVLTFCLVFQFHASAAVHYVNLNNPSPASPYTSWHTAATKIQNAIDAANSGDQILVTNGVYQSGGRVVYGSVTNRVALYKSVTVQSVNGPALTVIQGNPNIGTNAVRCVYITNNAMLVGFTLTNGATMDSTALDSAHDCYGGGAWCESTNSFLTNCVLAANSAQNSGGGVLSGTLNNCSLDANTNEAAYGSVLNNCTFVSNNGFGADTCILNDCVISNNNNSGAYNSTLNNCRILNNMAGDGAGAYFCTLSNCFLSGNVAGNGGAGGGALECTLNNCTLSGNSAPWGGGAWGSTLNNCLVVGNTAHNHYLGTGPSSVGGGVGGCTANNCTIVFNTAVQPDSPWTATISFYGGGAAESALNNCIVQFNSESPSYYVYNANNYNYYLGTTTNCCTSPLLDGGTGNFTSDPLLVNTSGSDFHLQSNSPCINSGNNADVTSTMDLDGNPRIVGGTVDIGAYEYQTPVSKISYAWLDQYGLPITTNIDTADLDGTGFNVYQDWVAGLNPTNALSVLAMLAPAPTNNPVGLVVSWQSVSGITYFLQSGTNLAAQPAFSTIQSNIVGQTGTTTYTDTTATNSGPYFYRVGVQ